MAGKRKPSASPDEFPIEPIATLRGCGSTVFSIAPWAGMFATVHADGTLRLWSESGDFVAVVIRQLCGDAFGWGDVLVSTRMMIYPRLEIRLWKKSDVVGRKLRSGNNIGFLESIRTLNRYDPRDGDEGYLDASGTFQMHQVVDIVEPWDDRLVLCYDDGDIETWDENGATLSRMIGHKGRITAVVALGEKLASASLDYTLRIWDATGACVSVMKHSGLTQNVMAWGERFAIAYADGTVRTWSGGAFELCDELPVRAATKTHYVCVREGALVTWSKTFVTLAHDGFGAEPMRLYSDKFLRVTHGLLATRDADAIRVWGVLE